MILMKQICPCCWWFQQWYLFFVLPEVDFDSMEVPEIILPDNRRLVRVNLGYVNSVREVRIQLSRVNLGYVNSVREVRIQLSRVNLGYVNSVREVRIQLSRVNLGYVNSVREVRIQLSRVNLGYVNLVREVRIQLRSSKECLIKNILPLCYHFGIRDFC